MKIRGIIITTVVILAIIAVSTTTAAALSCSGDICVNQSGWQRDGGAFNASTTPIQAAVDDANTCETICVAAGSYTDNVNVNKRLTLRGEGAGVVTVTAASSSDYVFNVTADYVNISGFTVTMAGCCYAGIDLSGADHCSISDNNASKNYFGIRMHYSSNNTLIGNTASNNCYGICLWDSSDNTLIGNTAESNKYDGIRLDSSSDNTLVSNTASNNTASNKNCYGIFLLSSSSSNLIYNNYFNNTNNANNTYDSSNNQWNITKTAGTNIIGGPFLGGNYWGDYAGVDNTGDGLGDTLLPYNSTGGIRNGGDLHPLTTPPAAFTTADAVIALEMAVGSCPLDLCYDVSGDGQVTSLDALMIVMDTGTG